MSDEPMLSRYKILEKLGAGGMGVVYRAEDTTLQRRVALKFMLGDLAAQEDLRVRFLREARTSAALNHPNICTIHEVGEVEPGTGLRLEPDGTILPPGTPFLAMELVEGRTLQATLSGAGPLPLKSVLRIGNSIAATQPGGRPGVVRKQVTASQPLKTAGPYAHPRSRRPPGRSCPRSVGTAGRGTRRLRRARRPRAHLTLAAGALC